MNRKLLFAAIVVLLVVGAGVAYVLLQKDTGVKHEKISEENAQVQSNPPSDSSATVPGKYIEYTEDGFVATQGTKLLFFHASWCPQCRALDESIKTSQLPNNLTILKVDYDSNQSLRAKYGVTLQTTIVKTDEKGNKIGSYVAYDEPTFQSVKQALLP